MIQRFLESKSFLSESRDFKMRRHVVSPILIAICFVVAAALISLTHTSFFVNSTLIDNNLLNFVLILVLLFILFLLCNHFANKYEKLINAVEFQNALFSGAARLATEFCLIMRYDGKVVYVDPEYDRKIFRYKNNTLRSINSFLDRGEVSQEARENLFAALATGKTQKIPFKLPKTKRGSRPLTLSLDPITIDAENESSDITLSIEPLSRPSGYFLLRVQQEEYKKEYDEYVDDFSLGFYTIKNSGEFSFISSSIEQLLDYTEGTIVNEKINIIDLVFDQELAKNLRSAKKDWQEVIILRSRNNTPVYVFINQAILRNGTGKIIGKHGVLIPLLASNIIEEDVVQRRKLQKSPDLIKYSPIATALLDLKANVTDSNKSFRDVTTIYGNKKINLLELIPEDREGAVKEFFADVLSGKNDGSKPLDIAIKTGEQETKAASLYLNRVTDLYGQLQSIIAHMVDTTELKNLELRFVHSQKMQAVGQLAGGIAHDFNNLLTAMMGFCDLLLMRHPAGDSSFSDIMQIKQNANRAANLVKQLLAFSRKQTLQPRIINITDALAELSNLVGRLIGEHIELKVIHGRDLKHIKFDKVQLEQVIINLAVNARDAMPDGGSLTIETKDVVVDAKHQLSKSLVSPMEDEQIEPGEYVLIEVSDTGTGISRDIIGKIFEPFFSTKPIGAGTGLGLATVYGIIRQTGGYIYISSKVGKGTKFSIFLKGYQNVSTGNDDGYISREDIEKIDVSTLTGAGNILLVEDETPVRIFSHNALTNKGYNVLDANCAEAAFEIVKEKGKTLDAIITDVVMPGMSGPDMIKKIRETYPDIKVIFISGYGEDAFIESYGHERKFNFLSKPYSLKQLILKVKEVIEE